MPPMIAALKHHKTTVILVALEIALTCAIVTNALFLIGDRIGAMRVTTGLAANELVWARSSGIGQDSNTASSASRAAADLAALRAMPGVRSVVMVNTLPYAGAWITCLNTQPGGNKQTQACDASEYTGTPGVVNTLGLHLVAGRDFLPDDYAHYTGFGATPPRAVIVARGLAERLWPGQVAVGKPIYWGDTGKDVSYVVGVVARLLNPNTRKPQYAQSSFLLPVKAWGGGTYVLRTTRAARDSVLRDVPEVLDRVDNERIITAIHSYADTVRSHFSSDRAMVWLLLVVIGCLLALTALGVVGLSSFWVQQRTKSIGIRRAVGATRRDILRYFLAENFLIVTLGVVVGLACAVLLNLWLMGHYELHRMPLWYLPVGAVVLWLLGQLAVLAPATRASNVPPVVATRSV